MSEPSAGVQEIRTRWRPASLGTLAKKNEPSSLTWTVRFKRLAVQALISWAWATGPPMATAVSNPIRLQSNGLGHRSLRRSFR